MKNSKKKKDYSKLPINKRGSRSSQAAEPSQLLLNLDLEEVQTGNCFPQESIPILDVANEAVSHPHGA